MKQQHYLMSLICCLMMCGCSDDSSGNKEQGTGDVPECLSHEDCDSELCLGSGKCAIWVGKGDACDDINICKDKLKCEDGVCVDTSTPEPEPEPDKDKCSGDNDCEGDLICVKEECVEVKQLQDGDDCDVNDKTAVCANDLSCHLGKCMTDEAFAEASKCQSDDDCSEDEYKTCLPSGLCGTIHPIGDLCDGEQNVCEEGLECSIAVCSQIVSEGDACSDDDFILCESDFQCIEDVCRKFEMDLEKGSECNSSYKLCKEELICRDSVCISEKLEDESCDDASFEFCASGLACLKGKCTPFGDSCEKTSDCQEKDSFCCLKDECGLKGYCIPYDDETTYDEMCRYKTKPGIFEAQIQCRWQPPADAYPTSSAVEMHPLVGHFGNVKGLPTTIAVVSRAGRDGNPKCIRFINPETCETLESINENSLNTSWSNYPAAADLDNDGFMEFIAIVSSKCRAYKWNATEQKHEVMWTAPIASNGTPIIFDVNGDGLPEVVAGTSVLNGQTGEKIFGGSSNSSNTWAIGNFDQDPNGYASLLTNSGWHKWDNANKKWVQVLAFSGGGHVAYADFGTPGATVEDFDYTNLDGYPEFVLSGGSRLVMYAAYKNADNKYVAQTLMDVRGFNTGGPVTIGDFDSDGLPEVGVASSGLFGVYDPRCKAYEEGKCADKNVLWERWSQDESSGSTGSSLFDFDGDGQAEAVYADECFTRVYEGKTGKVLFSSRRSSSTSVEAPVIADIDNDGSAEILMGSDSPQSCYNDAGLKLSNTSANNNAVDPIHEGIRCLDDEDCPTSVNCNKTIGFCTCSTDADCNTQYMIDPNTNEKKLLQQYICTAPIDPQVGFMTNPNNGSSRTKVKNFGARPAGWNEGDYKVCRATRKVDEIGVADMMIFKDRLDRWVSSRNIWNQHSYNIINIEDDGKVPTVQQWLNNWLAKHSTLTIDDTTTKAPLYNSFRLNKQGEYGAGMVPDITGRFIAGKICGVTEDGRHVITGKLCNRGTKPVSTNLPASFFYYDAANPDDRSQRICTSYTQAILGVGECDQVGCEVTEEELDNLVGHDVIMVTNLDENGFASTVECNSDNNTDIIHIDSCKTEDPIEIVN